jgi:bleomycin hydrolase
MSNVQRKKDRLKAKKKSGIKKIKHEIKNSTENISKILTKSEELLIKEFMARCAPLSDPLDDKQLEQYSEIHFQDPINLATENSIASTPIEWLAENRKYISQIDYAYSHIPEKCPKPTCQDNSGRCWLFASLNTIRHNLINKFNLNDTFELSETYLFFFDKIERSLYFLEKMVEFKDQPIHDMYVNGMITYFAPTTDGGTWSFFVNLIKKYGILPKSCYGEGYNSRDTSSMNEFLYAKLGEFTTEIRDAELSEEELQTKVRDEYMPEIYSLMVKFLGEPPKEFNWNYHEAGESFEDGRQRGTFRSVKDLTPMKFFLEYVEPDLNISTKVVLRHDPREGSPDYRTYCVEHFGAMVGGKPDITLAVPWEVLSETAARAVMNGHQLWFSADVGKSMSYEHGILSTEAFDFEKLLNTKFVKDKAADLDVRISAPTHAMVLVGVDVEDDDPAKVSKWKVENSWGEHSGGMDPGYLMMTQGWFAKYGYEVAVDIECLDEETRQAYDKYEFDPIYLPFNDAFGAVARFR